MRIVDHSILRALPERSFTNPFPLQTLRHSRPISDPACAVTGQFSLSADFACGLIPWVLPKTEAPLDSPDGYIDHGTVVMRDEAEHTNRICEDFQNGIYLITFRATVNCDNLQTSLDLRMFWRYPYRT
jgi:hypothetical protein